MKLSVFFLKLRNFLVGYWSIVVVGMKIDVSFIIFSL